MLPGSGVPVLRPALLALLYAAVALAPAVLLPDGRSPWDHAVSAATRAAFALLFVEFVLSGRFRVISGALGMDATMRLHQAAARPVAAVLLLHPFLYGGVVAPIGLAALTGILSWLLLGLLVVTAIGRDRLPWSYEAWRLSHGVGALLLAVVATLHAVLAPAGAHPALAWVWLGLCGLAAASLVSVYLLRPLRRARRPWRVVSVTPESEGVWTVTIAAERHEGLRFRAGQFVWLVLDRGPFTLREHPFSIASAPSDPRTLSFVIAEAGDFTRTIGTLRPGARAYLDGPHGALTPLDRDAPGLVLIAGGTGIAPMLSILREAAARADRRPFLLIVGAWREERLIAREAIRALKASLSLEVVEVLSDPPPGWAGETGVLDDAVLGRHCGGARRGWLHVLCGPPGMLRAATASLAARGVARRDIMAESFRYD